MRLSTGKVFGFVVSSIAVISIGGLLWHRWLPLAASLHSSALDRQFHWTLINTAIVFVATQFALGIAAWRFGASQKKRTSSLPDGVSLAIVVSVAFIAIELFGAATLGRRAWASMYSAPPTSGAIRVQAMGQQFAFYFRYPGRDNQFGPIHISKIDPSIGNYFGLDPRNDSASRDDITSASLALPVNRPVELVLDSQDVIHSFYVREFRIQQDMVPGMHIPVHFTPTKTGTYEIVCTQLCGLGHYRMRAYLQVMQEAEFEKWMQARSK